MKLIEYLKMLWKIINIFSSKHILECQFNLTQYVYWIFKSQSVFTAKSKGGTTCTKLWINVKWYLHTREFTRYDISHLTWNFTWFHSARSFTWTDFTPFHDHGTTEVRPWIPFRTRTVFYEDGCHLNQSGETKVDAPGHDSWALSRKR